MIPPRLSPWYVDPRFVSDEEERKRVVARAKEQFHCRRIEHGSQRRFMRKLHAIVMLLAVLVVITLGSRGLFDWALLVLAAAVVASLVIYWLRYRERRPFLLDALRAHGDQRCIACDHPMRGLPKSVIFCPECGAVRVFNVPDEELDLAKAKSCES